jgi:hypothetical protein
MPNYLAQAGPSMASRPKSDTKNRGELSSLRIELAENGCIVTASFEPLKPPSNTNPYPDPESRVFGGGEEDGGDAYVDDALKYIGMMLRGQSEYEKKEK